MNASGQIRQQGQKPSKCEFILSGYSTVNLPRFFPSDLFPNDINSTTLIILNAHSHLASPASLSCGISPIMGIAYNLKSVSGAVWVLDWKLVSSGLISMLVWVLVWEAV